MGSCFSSSTAAAKSPFQAPTRVVALDGSLREYTSEVKAYEALGSLHPSCVICSSDELYCNAHIPALDLRDSLQLGQLYFVLPASKLQRPLSGADMAALAIKASIALSAVAGRKKEAAGGRRRAQVMPVAAELAGDLVLFHSNEATADVRFSVTPAERKKAMKRSGSSRRGQLMLQRTYRPKLSTIEEIEHN